MNMNQQAGQTAHRKSDQEQPATGTDATTKQPSSGWVMIDGVQCFVTPGYTVTPQAEGGQPCR